MNSLASSPSVGNPGTLSAAADDYKSKQNYFVESKVMDRPKDFVVDDNGNMYITGERYGEGFNCSAYLLKISSSGTVLLNITWGDDDPLIHQYGQGIDLDDDGNIYMAGYYVNETTDVTELPFVAKFDSNGNELMNFTWGNSTAGYTAHAIDITLDEDGNIYVAGHKQDFDSHSGAKAATITKFNSSGDHKMNTSSWIIETIVGEFEFGVSGIALDAAGNVFISGTRLDNLELQNYMAIVAKYDTSLNHLWNATYFRLDRHIIGQDIAVDSSGNSYISGSVYHKTQKNVSAFVSKFNSDGDSIKNITRENIQTNIASLDDDFNGCYVELDVEGNIYLSGTTNTTGTGTDDAFLMIYDGNGNSLKSFTYDSGKDDTVKALTLDDKENIYVLGQYVDMTAMSLYNFIAIYEPIEEPDDDDDDDDDDAAAAAVPGPDILLIGTISAFTVLFVALHLSKRHSFNSK